MKPFFCAKSLLTWAVVVAVAGGVVARSDGQPAPTPPASSLPEGVAPGTPLADVVKMVQAGVDVSTIQSYIANSQSAFNLDADKILLLKDEGTPSDLINAMLDRDKVLYAANVAPPPAPAAPAPPPAEPMATDAGSPPDTGDMAPPATEVDVNYFNDSLSPYGSWVDIDGYGRCWRPTVVIYDSSWRPYCDRGHWVYTDYGWYWDSDYAWGSTFHYGRWFQSPQFGWCWYPDTVWASSWVTFRSGGDYCGWAPLPPFAVFRPGFGFFYRGASVGLDFDFGLPATCFTFVSPDHFCDRRPRSFAVAPEYVTQVFHRTTVVNNFNANSKFVVNRGIPVEHIASVSHRTIEPVHVSTLPNAGLQGWRGAGFQRTLQRNNSTSYNNNNAGRTQFEGNQPRPNAEPGNTFNNNYNNSRVTTTPRQNFGQPVQGTVPGANTYRAPANGNTRVESQDYVRQPAQPSIPQNNAYRGYATPNAVPPTGEQPNRDFRQTVPAEVPERRTGEFPQGEAATPSQPREEVRPNVAEPGLRAPVAVPAQPQPQPRPAVNNGNANANANNARNQNKQDQ